MNNQEPKFSELKFEDLRLQQDIWVKERYNLNDDYKRDWDQFHQPRNLLLAMIGEVGEVSELF